GLGNEKALKRDRFGPQRDSQEPFPKTIKPFFYIVWRRFDLVEDLYLQIEISLERADKECRLVRVACINKALRDSRLPRNFVNRHATPAVFQEQAGCSREQTQMPPLGFLARWPPALATLKDARLELLILH